MKSAKTVSKKLKEVTFRYWIVFYKKLTKRIPENCLYSRKYTLSEKDETYLCFIHQKENQIDPQILSLCEQCNKCDAFIPKYNREEAKELFLQDLNNKKIKEKKYPEICALEWVLDRNTPIFDIPSHTRRLWYKIKSILSF